MTKIKPDEIEKNENDPFAGDLLDRQSEIRTLTPIIKNVQSPLVLSLDSSWGTGKTTFVKFWRSYLQTEEQEQQQSIYFSAWETDYAEDPLIVLVAELDKWVKANGDQTLINHWTDKVKETLPKIAKRAAIAGIKAATLGILNVDEQIEGIAADLTSEFTSDLLDNFNKQSEAIIKFKEIVEQALENLGDNQKSLIIFIDELDRCRPTYAIELLERIKHLFGIRRLVFVLSTDMTQLAHSIQGVYGHQFDAKKYLQRFIDLDYSLKKPDNKNYIKSQLDGIHFADRTNRQYTQERIIDCCYLMAKRFNLTLREINLLLTRISLISCSISTYQGFHEPLLIALLILRDRNNTLYERYTESPGVAGEVIEFIAQTLSEKEQQDLVFCEMIGYLIAPAYDSHRIRHSELIQPYKDAAQATDNNHAAHRAATLVLTAEERLGSFCVYKDTIARIELLNQFTFSD
jgi:hypothetical protein